MSDAPSTEPVRLDEGEDAVTIEVTVAAPVATVWKHLREPELISRWHGWDYAEDGGLAGEIDLIYRQGARETDVPYVLETKGGAEPGSFEHGDRFDLREQDGRTVVRITRGPRGTDPGWDAMYDDVTQGWISFLAQLRFAVERQAGVARRTVFLACGPAAAAARDLLGLAALEVGQTVSVREPAVTGTTWFRTQDQSGITVDAYGPGVVVVGDKPAAQPAPGRAVEQSMVIVSTYGLDDDAFAAVERSWRQWWAQAHDASAQDAATAPS